MLFTSLLVATAAFSGVAIAQNETNTNLPPGIENCCKVQPNLIPSDQRDMWCRAQRNTCPELCGGVNQMKNGQECDSETLDYECECKNGTVPQMELYQQSVPGLMCRFWFDRCINATNENLEFQVECRNQRDEKCGNLTTDGANPTSSASPSATQSGSDNSPAESGGSAPSTTPTGAASTLNMAREYGTPLLVGGIAAFFGLAL